MVFRMIFWTPPSSSSRSWRPASHSCCGTWSWQSRAWAAAGPLGLFQARLVRFIENHRDSCCRFNIYIYMYVTNLSSYFIIFHILLEKIMGLVEEDRTPEHGKSWKEQPRWILPHRTQPEKNQTPRGGNPQAPQAKYPWQGCWNTRHLASFRAHSFTFGANGMYDETIN